MASLLLAENFYSIIREIIALASQNCERRKGAAVAEIILFSIISLFLVAFPVIYIFKEIYYKKENKWIHIVLILVQSFGALLFIYGDNINQLIGRYSKELCDNKCLERINTSARVTLGLSLTIFHALPYTSQKMFKIMNKSIEEDEETVWLYALNITTTVVKIDSIYTVVTTAITDEFCSDAHKHTGWIFFVIIFLCGSIMKIIDSLHPIKNRENNKDGICIGITSFVSIICLFLYLLADNTQPIDCAFGCNFNTLTNYSFECNTSSNMTEMEGSCNITGNSTLRLVFMIVTFGGFLSVVLISYFKPHQKKNNRIEPV